MKKFIFLLLLASLSGCASMQRSSEDADPVPASRLYGYSKKSDAQLFVILDSEFKRGCMIRLFIDGKPAADFSRGEMTYFGITIGTHKLLALPLAECANSALNEVEIHVKAGDALVRCIAGTAIEPIPLSSR